jgi:EAL domain-containing protein (putative c-di-GMP-specific phosphodiesterase class I)
VVQHALEAHRDLHAADASWNDAFSINLSGASFSEDSLLKFIRATLQHCAVPPESICFEITETAAIANMSRVMEFIDEMKALGCRFSLDDFGSGLSSFAYLKNFHVDYLKIDGAFVRDMAEDKVDHAMVEAIHRIGQVMGIRTVAEFVENDAILDKLSAIGVDYAQGYGIHRPEPLLG